jgi:nitrogen regulatory protein PII
MTCYVDCKLAKGFNMYLDQHARVITCILPAGYAHAVLQKLYEDKGISRAGFYHVRGVGGSGALRSSFVEQTEKDVLAVVVRKEQADEIFTYLYEAAEIYRPHHGFMYMQKLEKATALSCGLSAIVDSVPTYPFALHQQ